MFATKNIHYFNLDQFCLSENKFIRCTIFHSLQGKEKKHSTLNNFARFFLFYLPCEQQTWALSKRGFVTIIDFSLICFTGQNQHQQLHLIVRPTKRKKSEKLFSRLAVLRENPLKSWIISTSVYNSICCLRRFTKRFLSCFQHSTTDEENKMILSFVISKQSRDGNFSKLADSRRATTLNE